MKLVIVTMFFSGGLIPKYLLMNSLKLVGTRWAILLPTAINTFNLIVLINFFKTIPLELEEAALIDGMGYFGIMRNVFIPLSIPAMATICLYYAVYFWNDWFNALIYLKSEQYPVMMILRNLVNGTMQMDSGNTATERSTVSIALKSAVIITSSVPIVVLYPFLSKYFVKGLTIGGVKG
jgi:putative aldouronate transport system permease protein